MGNTLEAVVAVYLLRLVKFKRTFDRLTDTISFIILACLFSTAISSTIGVSSLYMGGVIEAADFFKTWLPWWVGDALSLTRIKNPYYKYKSYGISS